MGKIELFINSLDLSDVVASIGPEGDDAFTVKLRRIGKSGRLSKQAQLYTRTDGRGYIAWGDIGKKTRVPIVVYCHITNSGLGYSFPDAYLTFEPGKISIRKKNKPISFSANIGGGFVVPAEFRDRFLAQMAQEVGVPRALIGEPVRIPRARIENYRYQVGVDVGRPDADVTVIARQLGDATGRSAADVENDIQNAINLETSRIIGREVEIRLDDILLNGDEVADDE